MRAINKYHIIVCAVLMLASLPSLRLRADISTFHLEVGLQAGLGYYVGDATPYIFQDVKEVAGAQLRYKFDERWSIQAKGQWQRIAYSYSDVNSSEESNFQNPLWSTDITAEFNFFRFGIHPYDQQVKAITPFVFIGVGMSFAGENASMFNTPIEMNVNKPNCYIPLGVGVKWKFAERWQLQAAWQHQVYISNGDGLEGIKNLDDPHHLGLNGINIMNNDLTSSLTVGIVYEFWKKGEICVHCQY